MSAPLPRQTWIDLLKGGAILWIFVNHAAEAVFGAPYFGNPSAAWPPLAERWLQVQPTQGLGWELFRYVGWLGDQGVQLFIVASGFGLTWSLLAKGTERVEGKAFFLRRAARLMPLWWGAHLVFCAFRWGTGVGPFPTDPAFWLSLVGIRCTPETYYYAVPAWWYVGLQIQLYLVLPLLWTWLRRFGRNRVLLGACVVAFAARAAGFWLFDAYIDPWQRGAVFITRLPEFVFGMWLADWMATRPDAGDVLRRKSVLAGAFLLWAGGTAASFTAPGIVVFTFATAVGLVPLVYAAVTRFPSPAFAWLGRHAYGLYLVHHPIALVLIEPTTSIAWCVFTVGLTALLSVAATLALERLVDGGWAARIGGGVLIAGACGGLYVAELAVREHDPQEVLGWGERPSLQPDATVGWKLRPDQETRLRWASYDYTVRANSLGFPGPEPADPKVRARVMVLGDAFSSAEGVDTADAWPRLLEAQLGDVEVVNLAITGHGPNQYAAVAKSLFPRLQPDLVLVASFINDFEDASFETRRFHELIGFHLGPPTALRSRVRPLHLRAWVKLGPWDRVRAALSGTPSLSERYHGGVQWLQRPTNALEVGRRFHEIDQAAGGASVRLVLFPARAQVCGPPQDLPVPQHATARLGRALGWKVLDLRAALAPAPCTYQPKNLHLTEAGHQRVAEAVATAIR